MKIIWGKLDEIKREINLKKREIRGRKREIKEISGLRNVKIKEEKDKLDKEKEDLKRTRKR